MRQSRSDGAMEAQQQGAQPSVRRAVAPPNFPLQCIALSPAPPHSTTPCPLHPLPPFPPDPTQVTITCPSHLTPHLPPPPSSLHTQPLTLERPAPPYPTPFHVIVLTLSSPHLGPLQLPSNALPPCTPAPMYSLSPSTPTSPTYPRTPCPPWRPPSISPPPPPPPPRPLTLEHPGPPGAALPVFGTQRPRAHS